MCGICGAYRFQNHISQTAINTPIRGLTHLMTRRGPDDEGYWNDTRCAFGFRRLAILDLAPTGHQPMQTADGRYVLLFNGEVYNFGELRPVLEGRGVHFRSTGDAEVVLYALAEWGTDALQRFNGMFALAFYDTQAQTLLLARDHAGIKPLYYLHTAKGVVFASQYNQVIQHPWAKGAGVSADGLGLYLRFGYIPAPYGLLENTHLLETGSYRQFWPDGRSQSDRFYAFPRFSRPTLYGEAAFDALDDALGKSVARHLISDVPVGIFLSGGIDSPLVAAQVRRSHSAAMQAFSIGVDDPHLDELPDARHYAQDFGLEHLWRTADEATALALLDDVIAASTEPSADFSIFPTLMVSQLASQHVKVALSGDGGDELFWGYPSRFGAALQQAAYFRYPLPLRWAAVGLRRLGWGQATRESFWPSLGRMYQKKHTLMAENDLQACFLGLPPLPADFKLFDYAGTDPQEAAQWLRWNEFELHLQRILLKVDRASMHYSLETRVPLLDKEVIAVACQTDWQSCLDLKTGLGKRPLREVLARRSAYQTTAKKGFTVPMRTWLMGALRPLLEEKVLRQGEILGLPLNGAALRQVYDVMAGGDAHKAWGLWLLLSLVLWQERHTQGVM